MTKPQVKRQYHQYNPYFQDFKHATIGKDLDRLTNTVSSIDKMMVSVQKDQQQHKEPISQLSLNAFFIFENIYPIAQKLSCDANFIT